MESISPRSLQSYIHILKHGRTSSAEVSEDQNDDVEIGEQRQTSTVDKVPDGGFRAWLQVVGGFSIFFNTWGLLNSYGVYQTHYESVLLTSESNSNISWIGSTQGFLLLFGSILAGRLYDTGHLLLLLFLGTFLLVFGMMMTSICTEYWQLFVAQGLIVGAGAGLLFLPSVAIMSQYFTKKRSSAIGIASLGGSVGGVVYPIIFRQLQPTLGFGWAVRVMSFVMLSISIIPLVYMRQRFSPVRSKKSIHTAIHNTPYVLFCFAVFFGYMGIYVLLFYIQLYAAHRTNIKPNIANLCLTIINASSCLGRLVASYSADLIGPLNVHIPSTLGAAVLAFVWIVIKDEPGIIALCILYGITTGAFFALPGPIVISISTDLSNVGVQTGMMTGFAGLGLLIGTPVAGAILGDQNWVGLQIWAGTSITVSVLLILTARSLQVGGKFGAKA